MPNLSTDGQENATFSPNPASKIPPLVMERILAVAARRMWRCEKTRKWERNIKRGVGFFPGAAATTEERGTMPEWQIKDARMVSGKNSHFCSSLWHCQPHDRKWLGNWRSGAAAIQTIFPPQLALITRQARIPPQQLCQN